MRNRQSGMTLLELMIVIAIVVIVGGAIAALAGGGCTGEDDARRAAEAHGFRDVEVIDTHRAAPTRYGCSESDGVAFEVRAKNSNNMTVDFLVCCDSTTLPFSKGCTIRTR